MEYVFLFIGLIVIMCCLLGIRYSAIWLVLCMLMGSMLTTDSAKCSESVLCNMQVLLVLPIGVVSYIGLFILKRIEDRHERKKMAEEPSTSTGETEDVAI